MGLGTLVSDFKKDAEAVKNFIVKIAGDAPAVVAAVTKDEAAIVPVLEAFLPKSSTAISLGNTLLDAVAQAVEDAGPAAGSSGLFVPLDQTVVSDVRAVIAAAKAAAAKA